MSTPASYNLLDQPWIAVLGTDNTTREVSIRTAFAEAPSIRSLAGELPTQDAAVLRLLLAILHRALPVVGDDEALQETWAAWWQAGLVPTEVNHYLDDWHDRFDLFSEEHPFYQVPDLQTAKGAMSGVDKLIADLPAGHRFFTNRAGIAAESLPLTEAARWLVHCQAFDPSGIKSGAIGDPRVKGGKGYPIGTGWAGNLGLLILEGANLAETLLLNLVLSTRSDDDDTPAWEVDEWTAAPSTSDAPRGPAQAMTWQIRRIRLQRSDDHIRDALICNGDAIRVRNQHHRETMSGWRRSEAQEKKHGESLVYMPRAHQSNRAVWRGLEALLAADPVPIGERKEARSLGSANLSWLADLRHAGYVNADQVVTIHTVGAEYGSNNSVVDAIISDRMVLRAEVVQVPELQACAVRAAAVAENAARLLGRLAADLAVAEGREADHDRSAAVELAYERCDPLFRIWLAQLSSNHTDEHEASWRAKARGLALALGSELFAAASPTAIRGRFVTDRNGRDRRADAASAHQRFVRQIWADIPAPESRSATSSEETTK